MSLKILIADKFPDEKIDEVTGLGCAEPHYQGRVRREHN